MGFATDAAGAAFRAWRVVPPGPLYYCFTVDGMPRTAGDQPTAVDASRVLHRALAVEEEVPGVPRAGRGIHVVCPLLDGGQSPNVMLVPPRPRAELMCQRAVPREFATVDSPALGQWTPERSVFAPVLSHQVRGSSASVPPPPSSLEATGAALTGPCSLRPRSATTGAWPARSVWTGSAAASRHLWEACGRRPGCRKRSRSPT